MQVDLKIVKMRTCNSVGEVRRIPFGNGNKIALQQEKTI